MIRITRVIVAYGSGAALHAQGPPPPGLRSLVVDNASPDDTAEVAVALGHELLRLPKNVGFGAGVMAGLARVETEFAFVLNPDAIPAPGAEAALIAAAARYPDTDILLPRIEDETGAPFFRHEAGWAARAKRREVPQGDWCAPMFSGAALFLRCDPFVARGGFDPDFFLFYEDDDLALRRWQARTPAVYVADAVVRHAGDGSSAGSPRARRIKDVSFGWSRVHAMRKHRAPGVAMMLVGMVLKLPVYLVAGRIKRLVRQWRRMEGAIARLRGRPAPFRDPDALRRAAHAAPGARLCKGGAGAE
jgi:GT2 family glycosyltransferase